MNFSLPMGSSTSGGGGSEDNVLCREDEGCSGLTNVLFIFNDDCAVDEEGLASFFIFCNHLIK